MANESILILLSDLERGRIVKRRAFTLEFKLKIIEEAKNSSNQVVGQMYDIGERIIRQWRTNEAKFLQAQDMKMKKIRPSASDFTAVDNLIKKEKVEQPTSICDFCGKSISHGGMRQHILVSHTEEHLKPYICEYCQKGFISKQRLEFHLNTHTGNRPYMCKFCGRGFADRDNMRKHENCLLYTSDAADDS